MHNAKVEPPASVSENIAPAKRFSIHFDFPQLVVLTLFLLSGACGLIYEVLWCRQLGLIYGNTVQSLSAVLTAFMGGLALGSFVAGRLCYRIKRPLMVYGVLELLIGVYCALLPLIFDSAPLMNFYRSLYGETGSQSLTLLRFLISFLLLLIPTTLMGATLPILTHHLVKSNTHLGSTVGRLYAVNSFGAVIGALAAGFFLLPVLGKIGSNYVAVVLNLTLGVLAMAVGFRRPMSIQNTGQTGMSAPPNGMSASPSGAQAETPAPLQPPVLETTYSPRLVKLVVLTFAITGFAAMATQIGWTRAISLGTGSSTYAFSLIIAIFILGLSAGGLFGSRAAHKTPDPAGLLGIILLLIGTLCMGLSTALGYGPFLFFVLIAMGSESYNMVLAGQAAGIAALIFLPTFLMGMSLPLTIQIASRSSDNAGRTVGTLYAINTLGSILGSFLCGLVILPALQIQRTLELMALLYAVPAIAIFALSESRKVPRSMRVMGGVLLPLLIMIAMRQPWDRNLMSSGMFLLRDKNMQELIKQGRYLDSYPNLSNWDTVYYNEGSESTVTVTRSGTDMTLRVGGKPDATAKGDLSTQLCLTMVPEILHPTGAEDVLVIGLGSGVSVGVALSPSTVKRVDIVEMSREVVEASWWFRDANKLGYAPQRTPKSPDEIVPQWINTPRVEVIVNDGRNHLLLTNRRYDVIASEPSNPWLAGVGNLFTLEAFQLARSRLKPGGIMCQWLHSYSLESDHVYSVVRTFGDVFKHVQIWNCGAGDYMLVGSESSMQMPIEQLRERMAQPGIRAWLEKVNFDTEAEFLATLLQSDQAHDLSAFRQAPRAGSPKPWTLLEMAASARQHTDDNMILEFEAPRALYKQKWTFRSQDIYPFPEKAVRVDTLPPQQQSTFYKELDLAVSARQCYRAYKEIKGNLSDFVDTVKKLAPHQYWLEAELSKAPDASKKSEPPATPADPREQQLRALIAEKQQVKALDVLRQLLDGSPAGAEPSSARLWAIRAEILSAGTEKREYEEGLRSIGRAIRLNRGSVEYFGLELLFLRKLNRIPELMEAMRWRARLAPSALSIGELCKELLAESGRARVRGDVEQSKDLLHESRRAGREWVTLYPKDIEGWVGLCRTLLVLEKECPQYALAWKLQATEAYDTLLHRAGADASKLPADITAQFKR